MNTANQLAGAAVTKIDDQRITNDPHKLTRVLIANLHLGIIHMNQLNQQQTFNL
jgi:hypothetical protein